MSSQPNLWYRTARILAIVFAVSTIATISWIILLGGRHAVAAGGGGETSALLVPVVSLGTMLLSAIGTGSTVVLGWRSERRQNREFGLKIQLLEKEMKRGADRAPKLGKKS